MPVPSHPANDGPVLVARRISLTTAVVVVAVVLVAVEALEAVEVAVAFQGRASAGTVDVAVAHSYLVFVACPSYTVRKSFKS